MKYISLFENFPSQQTEQEIKSTILYQFTEIQDEFDVDVDFSGSSISIYFNNEPDTQVYSLSGKDNLLDGHYPPIDQAIVEYSNFSKLLEMVKKALKKLETIGIEGEVRITSKHDCVPAGLRIYLRRIEK